MKKLPAIFFSFSLVALMAPSSYAVPSDGTTSSALLTEAKGTVYKRGFIDWSKEKWGEAQPAKVGDTLGEGMQVGTGDKSWAQIAWQYVTCRAWANSVYAIAPHQRLVYLSNGEMLFHLDKNRAGKDKDNYCIWTNLLQARVRGTTVLVQATADKSRITVLEGTVDVLNKLDHSVVRIKPGVVLEVNAKGEVPRTIGAVETNTNLSSNKAIERALNSPATTTVGDLSTAAGKALSTGGAATVLPGSVSTVETMPQELTNIVSNKQAMIPLFDDVKSTTNLFIANADILLNHGLVSGLESELSSLPLVKTSLSELPTLFHEGGTELAEGGLKGLGQPPTDSPIVTAAAEILRAPTRTAYDVGPNIGAGTGLIHIKPTTVALFPPQSIIGSSTAVGEQAYSERTSGGLRINQSGHRVLTLSDPLFQLPVLQSLISPQLPGGANVPGASSFGGNSLVLNNSVLVNRTLGTVGLTGSTASAILNGTGNSALFGGVGGVAGLTGRGSVAGLTGINGLTGIAGLTGSLGGTVGSTLGGVSSLVTGVSGTVNGTLGSLGGTVGGSLGGTVSGFGGTVGGTLGNLGGTLNGLGSGLGGLLGGHH